MGVISDGLEIVSKRGGLRNLKGLDGGSGPGDNASLQLLVCVGDDKDPVGVINSEEAKSLADISSIDIDSDSEYELDSVDVVALDWGDELFVMMESGFLADLSVAWKYRIVSTEARVCAICLHCCRILCANLICASHLRSVQ